MQALADLLRSLLVALFIPLWFLGSGWACYSIWVDSEIWVSMDSYVQVNARVVEVRLDTRRKSVSEKIRYTYFFNGADYSGSNDGRVRAFGTNTVDDLVLEMKNTAPNGVVPAWVDRHRPWVSVLDRNFGWPWIGMLFAIAIGAFVVAYGNLPNRSVADLVRGERWQPKALLALLWILSVLPALRAVLALRGQPVMWVLATLLATLIGVLLVFRALKACFARRHSS